MRRGLVALAAVGVLAAAAPPASADHVTASVSATLELGPTVRSCTLAGLCARARRATVSWSASCGSAAPESIDVTIYGVRPDGTRFPYDGDKLDYEPPLDGALTMTAGPGLRFLGEVVVTCSTEVTDAEGETVDHRASATSTTAQFYLAPQLVGFTTTRSSFCGVNVPTGKLDKWLQAGQYAELAWLMRYSGASLMRRGVPALRQIKLFARGAGIRLRRTPDRGMLREFDYLGTFVRPRRGGTLRIWATIGGKRTNTLRVRVLPKRC